MSETPDHDPFAPTETSAGAGAELDVDVTAFLPEPEPVDAAQLSEDLDQVDAALAALDAKNYGTNPETGELIADELLAVDPTRLS